MEGKPGDVGGAEVSQFGLRGKASVGGLGHKLKQKYEINVEFLNVPMRKTGF